MRLSSAVWRYIEHELFNYEHTKLELQALKDEIIDGAIHRGEGAGTGEGQRFGLRAGVGECGDG